MDAVQDASKAIELDGSNSKAYLRKGCVVRRGSRLVGLLGAHAASPAPQDGLLLLGGV